MSILQMSGVLGALAQRKVGDESNELTEAFEHLPSSVNWLLANYTKPRTGMSWRRSSRRPTPHGTQPRKWTSPGVCRARCCARSSRPRAGTSTRCLTASISTSRSARRRIGPARDCPSRYRSHRVLLFSLPRVKKFRKNRFCMSKQSEAQIGVETIFTVCYSRNYSPINLRRRQVK